MENARDQEKVISGVQRRLASSGSSSRKPSDAAKKRVEERAARNRAIGRSAVRSIKTAKALTPARVPAPSLTQAPVVDLLDFGNFDSPEANSAVEASETVTSVHAPAEEPNQEPQLDLFGSMVLGNNPAEGANIGQLKNLAQPQQAAAPMERLADQKKMSTSDIMSMFNSGSAQHNSMHQNMFAMQGGIPNNSILDGMSGCNNMTMMGQHMGGGGMNADNMAIMGNLNSHQQMVMMNNMKMMQQTNNTSGQPQQWMGNVGVNNMGKSMNAMNNMPMMQQRNDMMGQQQQGLNNVVGKKIGSNLGTNRNNMGHNGMMMHQQQQDHMPQMNNMIAADENMMMHQQQQDHMPQMNNMIA